MSTPHQQTSTPKTSKTEQKDFICILPRTTLICTTTEHRFCIGEKFCQSHDSLSAMFDAHLDPVASTLPVVGGGGFGAPSEEGGGACTTTIGAGRGGGACTTTTGAGAGSATTTTTPVPPVV
jgi:hypothetical protein